MCIETIRKCLARTLFGARYSGPHDYVSLRRRYAFHRGAYGWTRSWRVGRFTLTAEKNARRHDGVKWRLSDETKTARPYWNRNDWRWPFEWQK